MWEGSNIDVANTAVQLLTEFFCSEPSLLRETWDPRRLTALGSESPKGISVHLVGGFTLSDFRKLDTEFFPALRRYVEADPQRIQKYCDLLLLFDRSVWLSDNRQFRCMGHTKIGANRPMVKLLTRDHSATEEPQVGVETKAEWLDSIVSWPPEGLPEWQDSAGQQPMDREVLGAHPSGRDVARSSRGQPQGPGAHKQPSPNIHTSVQEVEAMLVMMGESQPINWRIPNVEAGTMHFRSRLGPRSYHPSTKKLQCQGGPAAKRELEEFFCQAVGKRQKVNACQQEQHDNMHEAVRYTTPGAPRGDAAPTSEAIAAEMEDACPPTQVAVRYPAGPSGASKNAPPTGPTGEKVCGETVPGDPGCWAVTPTQLLPSPQQSIREQDEEHQQLDLGAAGARPGRSGAGGANTPIRDHTDSEDSFPDTLVVDSPPLKTRKAEGGVRTSAELKPEPRGLQAAGGETNNYITLRIRTEGTARAVGLFVCVGQSASGTHGRRFVIDFFQGVRSISQKFTRAQFFVLSLPNI